MMLEKLLEEVNEICAVCEKKCDPCCTGYLIKKYIETHDEECLVP